MASAKETEGEKCYRELIDKARVLENRLEELLNIPQPVVDADYGSCFVEAHEQLTAERKPSPFPQPLLRARLVQSLKQENDSLKRLVAEFNGQLSAARQEIADWEARDKPTTVAVPSDYSTARTLAKTRRQQLSKYLKSRSPHPTAAGASGQATTNPCLTIDQTFDLLFTASMHRTPEMRYVRISKDFWLPHIQVFLDSGVAERDPNRSEYVRLSSDWL